MATANLSLMAQPNVLMSRNVPEKSFCTKLPDCPLYLSWKINGGSHTQRANWDLWIPWSPWVGRGEDKEQKSLKKLQKVHRKGSHIWKSTQVEHHFSYSRWAELWKLPSQTSDLVWMQNFMDLVLFAASPYGGSEIMPIKLRVFQYSKQWQGLVSRHEGNWPVLTIRPLWRFPERATSTLLGAECTLAGLYLTLPGSILTCWR